MLDFSKYDFLSYYISDNTLESMLDMYIKLYNKGPFKGILSNEFLVLLNEKQRRNEIT